MFKYNDYELLYLYNIHSEEALNILLTKYEKLIEIKLHAFKIARFNFDDLKQECMLALMKAIEKYDERFNKTFYRFAELIIERKIMNFLRQEVRYRQHVSLSETLDGFSLEEDMVEKVSYEMLLEDIRNIQLSHLKESILQEIFFEGISIKEFSLKHNIDKKEVYNHIYLLRTKLKNDLL